jgi:hypothetical protein
MKKLFILCSFFLWISCAKKDTFVAVLQPSDIERVVQQMTDVMIHDITNPPLAARFFAYSCLAAYEVVALHDSTFLSLSGKLNEFPEIKRPKGSGEIHKDISALLAFYETAKVLQPSGKLMGEWEQIWIDSLLNMGVSEKIMKYSLDFAKEVSVQILKYAKEDRYNKMSAFPRYTPRNTEGTWYPTPPGYFPPVEPYFNTIRSFTLDRPDQFKPEPPISFSADKKSPFYTLMSEIKNLSLSQEQKEIAAFWDCNPFALFDNGHLLVGMKKISPGAHWMGIVNIACKKADISFAKAIQVNTVLAIGLMDGFQSCWDEKYRSNRIRPEKAIRKYLDPKWTPFLQTPPFPEYLSGHSTISSVSAIILAHFFGKEFSFTDTVEERYGLKARTYSSFEQAAEEAGISRFYGGIHFMDAIENGQKQGVQVGNHVLKKIFPSF